MSSTAKPISERLPTRHPHREALIDLQRQLSERNRRRIAEYEEILTPGFDAYEEEYNRDAAGYEQITTFSHLLESVRKSNITIVGDYHTLRVSQKLFVKIARRMRGRNIVLALEFFPAASQDTIDSYVSGRINEKTLLRKIKYRSRWPYDIWEHFKPIVDVARQRNWRVIGLDGPRDAHVTLGERDSMMAEAIVKAIHTGGAKTRVMALVGELHVADSHLPQTIRKQGEKRKTDTRITTVFQNSESIYWQLVKANREQEAEVVLVDRDRFNVHTAPPVVVQQSYLNWIEYNADTLDYDHLTRHFQGITSQIARALSIRQSSRIKALHVYGPGDLSFWEELETAEFDNGDPDTFLGRFGAERPQILLDHNTVYLSNLNINQVAEVAGRLLHCMLLDSNGSSLQSFYGQVIHEAIAFFSSKLINPKRKGHHEPHFRKLLRDVGPKGVDDIESLEAASAILLHKSFEKGRRTRAFHRIFAGSAAFSERVRVCLGVMLGERLYYAFARGKMSRTEIRTVLRFPIGSPEQAAALYFSLVRQIGREPIPKRI